MQVRHQERYVCQEGLQVRNFLSGVLNYSAEGLQQPLTCLTGVANLCFDLLPLPEERIKETGPTISWVLSSESLWDLEALAPFTQYEACCSERTSKPDES